MQCPHCNITLLMTERAGVEIDYCPQCRGVWLDRGELDKIIAQSTPQAGAASGGPEERGEYRGDKHGRHHGHGFGHEEGRHRGKKSLLGELFDF